MGTEFGVVDYAGHAYERSRLPSKIQEHVTSAFKKLAADQTLYIGVADLSGGWKSDYVESYRQGDLVKFLDWLTAHRHELLGNATEGFEAEARFIVLIVRHGCFQPKDPCHEQTASCDYKGFYRVLREMQHEPMET